MNDYEISDHLKRILKKISKKDKVMYEYILKKIQEIIDSPNPDHYKNIRCNLKDSKRVNIGSFVLVFRVVKNKIYFDDFDHHNNIY